MNITLSLDDHLVKQLRKLAVEQDTTLSVLVRDHLEKLVEDASTSGRRRRERQSLEQSFQRFRFRVGQRQWKHEDIYGRP